MANLYYYFCNYFIVKIQASPLWWCWVWTQGLMLTKQELYHLSHVPSTFALVVFQYRPQVRTTCLVKKGISWTFFPGLASNPDLHHLQQPSRWDYTTPSHASILVYYWSRSKLVHLLWRALYKQHHTMGQIGLDFQVVEANYLAPNPGSVMCHLGELDQINISVCQFYFL
jgi:hypothetical protein